MSHFFVSLIYSQGYIHTWVTESRTTVFSLYVCGFDTTTSNGVYGLDSHTVLGQKKAVVQLFSK